MTCLFLNKDGILNGGVEVEVSKPKETQSVQVKGQRKSCRKEKKAVIGTNYVVISN